MATTAVAGGDEQTIDTAVLDAALRHMAAYSNSMPHVVPSSAMAKAEIEQRNGWFMRRAAAAGRGQPKHEALLREVGIEGARIEALRGAGADDAPPSAEVPPVPLRHEPTGIEFYSRRLSRPMRLKQRPTSAIVVGAGMVGSALAFELSRLGLEVTVIDQRATPAAKRGDTPRGGEVIVCDDATSGSWAWLNANGKRGSYGGLNRLGMAMWRRAPVYREAAVWCGSLVTSASPSGETDGGAYAVDEDLDRGEASTLEPALRGARGAQAGKVSGRGDVQRVHFHRYPDEGLADPAEAAAALRAAAEAAGAIFLWGRSVEHLLRAKVQVDQATDGMACGGPAVGVRLSALLDENDAYDQPSSELRADCVVLAAGVGLASDQLGATVPMQHSPGRLAFTPPRAPGAQRELSGIFVDAISGSHCLQRQDGSCVVGGDLSGYGQVQDATAAIAADSTTPPGRTGDTTGSSEGNEGSGTGDELLRRASSWLPFLRGQAADATTLAHRVIPADGLPAIGFSSQSGAYVVASHSAITLAPILSALAAAEIVEGVEMEIIDEAWRPDRFLADEAA